MAAWRLTYLPNFEVTSGLNFVILRVYATPQTAEADTIQKLTIRIAVFYAANYLITLHQWAPNPLLDYRPVDGQAYFINLTAPP